METRREKGPHALLGHDDNCYCEGVPAASCHLLTAQKSHCRAWRSGGPGCHGGSHIHTHWCVHHATHSTDITYTPQTTHAHAHTIHTLTHTTHTPCTLHMQTYSTHTSHTHHTNHKTHTTHTTQATNRTHTYPCLRLISKTRKMMMTKTKLTSVCEVLIRLLSHFRLRQYFYRAIRLMFHIKIHS